MVSSRLAVARTAPASEDGVQLGGVKRPGVLTFRIAREPAQTSGAVASSPRREWASIEMRSSLPAHPAGTEGSNLTLSSGGSTANPIPRSDSGRLGPMAQHTPGQPPLFRHRSALLGYLLAA